MEEGRKIFAARKKAEADERDRLVAEASAKAAAKRQQKRRR